MRLKGVFFIGMHIVMSQPKLIVQDMATSNESICSTCNHFENCILRSDKIIWDCSEFDNNESSHLMPGILLLESIEARARLAI
ncbi:hypothetical protein SAMN05421640_2663 [Ekhidna lutea]|uniref:Uncharacterized protein n=1 Tax=Ekhidna lutea TaxID=447679 RepID=A0A239KGP8_EKHLU|nr:hypothetical protein [Ekhidna lutea]SNT17517.1 hypothetical protein SAMN05421640_2663 [Ekhidna lutea]